MLPNHSPLVIAEQFGTLASLYPDRIDLGVGRAPGSDRNTMRALRRDVSAADTFPGDVVELQNYFDFPQDESAVQAVPGTGLQVPIWILGSSLFGAQLAAAFGLPYAFASHFAPDQLVDALHVYRTHFQPSEKLQRPYVMLGLNLFAAETDQEAQYHFTSLQQQFLALRYGKPGKIPPPIDNMDDLWHSIHKAAIGYALSCSIVGSPETASQQLKTFIQRYQTDEIMATATFYDHQARLRSFEIAAEVQKTL